MIDPTHIKLVKFLDAEFAQKSRQKIYADPKVIFRAKDVVAGSLSIRSPSFARNKTETNATRGLHIAMGKHLVKLVQNGDGIVTGGYKIRMLSTTDVARGTRFMATRIPSPAGDS